MTARHLQRTVGLTLVLGALAIAFGMLGPPAHRGHAQGKDGKDELQGKWIGLFVTTGGPPPPQAEGLSVHIQGKRVTLAVGEKSLAGPFRVDAAQSPKQIDMDFLSFAPGGQQLLGIYKVEGDVLTLSLNDKSRWNARPKTFEDSGVFMVLKREGAKLTPAQEKDLQEAVAVMAAKKASGNNLHQIAVAMHNFHDSYKRFLPPVLLSKDGKPLLSWRVALLPFIEELPLYREFKLDEPWDSAHNIKLLKKMPEIYAPVRGKTKEPHATYYQLFVGPDAWPVKHMAGTFLNAAGLRIPKDFSNGTSNTIMAVEGGEPVPWTKPADLPFDAKKPLPRLGGLFKDGFNVAMVDGSIRFVRRTVPERFLRIAINRNSIVPLPVDWDKQQGK